MSVIKVLWLAVSIFALLHLLHTLNDYGPYAGYAVNWIQSYFHEIYDAFAITLYVLVTGLLLLYGELKTKE